MAKPGAQHSLQNPCDFSKPLTQQITGILCIPLFHLSFRNEKLHKCMNEAGILFIKWAFCLQGRGSSQREFSQTSGEWCTSATSQAPREPLFVGCTMIALGFYNIHPSSGSVSGNPSNPFCFPLKFHFTLLLLLFFSQIDKTMFYFIPALPHCPASSRKP